MMDNKITKDGRELKDNLTKFGRDVANKGEEGFNKVKREAKHMADNLEDKAYEIGAKAKDAWCQAEELAKCGTNNLEHHVRAHPFMTIGVSFLIGMLLGKLNSNK